MGVIVVVVIFLAAKRLIESTETEKITDIESLNREKASLKQERDALNRKKKETQIKLAEATGVLAEAESSRASKTFQASEVVKNAQTHFKEVQAEFEKTKRTINEQVETAEKAVNTARDAMRKAETFAAEGSYFWAWITTWGKEWEDYRRKKEKEITELENRKRKTKADLEEAQARLAHAREAAPKLLEAAQNTFNQTKEREENHLTAQEKKLSEIKEKENSIVSQKKKDKDSLNENLEDIARKEVDVEARLASTEGRLAAIPWLQRFGSEMYSVLRVHSWTLVSCALMLITPIGSWLRRLAVWFGPGAWIERRKKPLTFPGFQSNSEPITTTSNEVSFEVQVKAGEVAWFRNDYLDLTTRPRGTKFGLLPIFSKRFWLMSLIDGLWWMTVIRGDRENKTSFKVSDTDDSASEFAVVKIPANASLIIRPHFIVGLTFPEESPPKIKRHWRLTQLEAWCVGQLWFFELLGPSHVLLRGARGVQSNSAVSDESVETRLNPGSLIGFSPTAKLYVCRSESLRQYLMSESPFYNYLFEGDGTFLTHETKEKAHHSGPLSWLAGVGDVLLKLAGF